MIYMNAILDRTFTADELPGAVDRAIRGLLLEIADLAASCDELSGSFTPLDALGITSCDAERAFGATTTGILAQPIGYTCRWVATDNVVCDLSRDGVTHRISWLEDAAEDLRIPWLAF